MGSLLITPFSCTSLNHHPHQITMKAFTTIAALLGATSANPIQHIQYGSTGLRNINLHSSNNIMASKDAHIMPNQQMAQMVAPAMSVVAEMPKPVVDPNQYLLKDNFGNYAFGYSTQNSEMAEEGNAQSKKGHFANIMVDGKLRRVDYIADNQGFHILRDTADNTGRYIKREAEAEPNVEPTLIQTRMTSYMDSSSLMDDGKDMHRMPNNIIGLDMTSSNMRSRNNQMSSLYRTSDMMNHGMPSNMGLDMSPNMIGQDMTLSSMRARNNQIPSMHRSSEVMTHGMSSNMMGRDMSTNMMGHSMTSNMMGRGLSTDMINRNMDMNMMDQTMYTNMIGQGKMPSNMVPKEMPSIIMGQDMSSDVMERNMMGQDMSSNMMERNMMGQDMYSNAMDNNIASSNIMMSRGMNQMTPLNRMSQRMQIETMPSQSLNRFF